MSQTPTQRTTKVVKRYANRKLYDTERSCYVTLEEISQMIKEGEDVRVIDNKTKDDLTAVTLAQIIVEEEKKVSKMPLKLLRSIIQSGNDAIANLDVSKVAWGLKNDVEQRVSGLLKREPSRKAGDAATDGGGDGDAGATVDAAAEGAAAAEDHVKNGVIQEFVSSTTEAFESWQKKVDERIKDAVEKGTAKLPGKGPDVDALKRRVEELEVKIAALEGARKS